MGSTDIIDPYLDPATGILRNKLGARTQRALDAGEADFAFVRLMQLLDHPTEVADPFEELCAIHAHLFVDVYDWAGQIRTVDVRKNTPNAAYFVPVALIVPAAHNAVAQLRDDANLQGLEREAFVDRLAHHYEALNFIHPFREGNGRTQRVLWSRIARDAGWQIDWRDVHGSVNNEACRAASDDGNFKPLHDMFAAIVTVATPREHRDADWVVAERQRLSFKSPPPAPPGATPYTRPSRPSGPTL